jgi:hypothetical protein
MPLKFSSMTAAVLLVAVFVVIATGPAEAQIKDETTGKVILSDDYIRCKVCDRAIQHIWMSGVHLRTHCATHGTDPRCDITNMHKSAIATMVNEVCDELPKTHQSLLESEFEMIAHEDPQHEPEHIAAITASCKRWVHEEHSLDYVTRLMFANLDAGKSTQVILHRLQERFCDAACRKPVEKKNADL